MTLRWKKTLGQHLLHDQNILRKIAASLRLSEGDFVLEVGSGSGALTEHLVEHPVTVTAVEVDRQFFDILNEKFSYRDNFSLIQSDILDLDLAEIIPQGILAVVTGNLPYNITSQILFQLFSVRDHINRITVMIQKEVANRITADIRSKNRGILSVICQFHTVPELEFNVSRNCFFPKPKVDSAVVTLNMKPLPENIDPALFFNLVKTCFGKRRKTLRNSVRQIPEADFDRLESAFDLNSRPEELTLSDFVELHRLIYQRQLPGGEQKKS